MSIACHKRVKVLRALAPRRDDAAMTTIPASLHPSSAAALLRTAEAHELAAVVLRRRNPTAAKVHADAALGLRAKASRRT